MKTAAAIRQEFDRIERELGCTKETNGSDEMRDLRRECNQLWHQQAARDDVPRRKFVEQHSDVDQATRVSDDVATDLIDRYREAARRFVAERCVAEDS